MLFFTGQRRFGKWVQQVHAMGECWLRGETTALLTSQCVSIEQRPTKRAPDSLKAAAKSQPKNRKNKNALPVVGR